LNIKKSRRLVHKHTPSLVWWVILGLISYSCSLQEEYNCNILENNAFTSTKCFLTKKFPTFKESKCSLPWSQKPTTEPYPEPPESMSHLYFSFFLDECKSKTNIFHKWWIDFALCLAKIRFYRRLKIILKLWQYFLICSLCSFLLNSIFNWVD
jgi:hypothetical protein